MALNMYYKNGMIRKTRGQISDDLLPTLYQVHNNANFPQLTWLIDNLYENSQIQPDIAKALVDEIVAFERLILSLHLPFPRVPLQKLQTFFTGAATSQQTVYTSSDWVGYLAVFIVLSRIGWFSNRHCWLNLMIWLMSLKNFWISVLKIGKRLCSCEANTTTNLNHTQTTSII